MRLTVTSWAFAALIALPAYAIRSLPTHDQVLVDVICAPTTAENPEAGIQAAMALAQRHRDRHTAPATESVLRETFEKPETTPDARRAIVFYLGEVIASGDDGTTWNWMLGHYRTERDIGVRLVMAHALGELAQVEPGDAVSETSLRRHQLQYREACHHKIVEE
ncbi:hypothetical protein K2X33_03575 [bacterium]|nr:hypothetical protein [bacterium]